MNIRIVRFEKEHQNADFYSIMGPLFASRDIAKEMGGWQLYNYDDSVWWVATVAGKVVGCCSAFNKKTHFWWDNFYVLPEFRGHGISKILHSHRLRYCTQKHDKEIRCITDNDRQIKNYQRIGMIEDGKRGRYTKFKMESCL